LGAHGAPLTWVAENGRPKICIFPRWVTMSSLDKNLSYNKMVAVGHAVCVCTSKNLDPGTSLQRSLKVVGSYAVRWRTYDFLLAIRNHRGPFPRYAVENRNLFVSQPTPRWDIDVGILWQIWLLDVEWRAAHSVWLSHLALMITGDLRQHWHMRITSSKCVLQQRHLLGYRTQTLTLTLELTLTLTLFLTLTRTFFERKQKRHRNIGQHRVIFTGYLLTDGGGFIRGPYPRTGSFSYSVHVFRWRHTHVPVLILAVLWSPTRNCRIARRLLPVRVCVRAWTRQLEMLDEFGSDIQVGSLWALSKPQSLSKGIIPNDWNDFEGHFRCFKAFRIQHFQHYSTVTLEDACINYMMV